MKIKNSLLFFSIFICLFSRYEGYALYQSPTSAPNINLNLKGATLQTVFSELSELSKYDFSYGDFAFNKEEQFDVNYSDLSLEEALRDLAKKARFDFKIQENTVLIRSLKKGPPHKVSGTITDENGVGMPGVNVMEKGTANGVSTDKFGNFTITVSDESMLVITSLGYQTQEILVGSQTQINVVLKPGTSQLDEVIVVSYGKSRREEVTGSVSQIDVNKLQNQPVNQFAQQLQGKLAGVKIDQYSGQPGRGVGFRIRGAASLFANNQPLVVVDGIPVTGSINNINPAEIETISVLKDASSAALYGSRAANGVILITTKYAKPGESKVEFSSFYGVQQIPQNKIPDLMTAQEFAQFQKEYYEDRVKYEGYTGELDEEYRNPEELGAGTDWFNTLTRVAPIQKYNLTVSSARENSSSTVIAGYMKQDGVIINTGTELFSLRINQEYNIGERLKVGFRLAPSYRKDHNNRLGTDGLGGIVEDIVESSPLIDPVNDDGTYPLYVNSPRMVRTINPYARMKETKDDYNTTRILGNGYFDYDFGKGFSLNTNLAIDKGAETHNRFYPSYIQGNGIASGYSGSVDNYSWTAEANVKYNKTFTKDHTIEVLTGYSAQRFYQESNSVNGSQYPSDDISWVSAATVIDGGSSNTTSYALLSQLARINYNFKQKYFISGAMRRDGSSRFGADSRYGNFPSISTGWIVSREKFMENVRAIDFLKARFSYGITGNNNIGNYTHIPNLGGSNYVFNGTLEPGITITSLGNSRLEWEKCRQFDLGLDVYFLNNHLSFTYDYYNKISDGLIQNRPIPRASGFTTIKSNIGEIKFWGHEFTVGGHDLLKGKLKWNANLNISVNRNVIQSLVDPGFLRRNNTSSSDYYRHQEGHSLGEFYGFIFTGLYQDAEDLANSPVVEMSGVHSNVGTIKMKDVNGDGKINEEDRTFIGDPTPNFDFGFTNEFEYGNFDLSIAMQGSVGGKIVNPVKWAYLGNLDGARMLLTDVQDRWRSPENPGSGVYPRTETGTTAMGRFVNTQWIEDGTYLSINNITLGYNLNFGKKYLIKDLRVYASVQNAFVFTKYTGMNPQINVGGMDPSKGLGIDENGYPLPRIISLGLKATIK